MVLSVGMDVGISNAAANLQPVGSKTPPWGMSRHRVTSRPLPFDHYPLAR